MGRRQSSGTGFEIRTRLFEDFETSKRIIFQEMKNKISIIVPIFNSEKYLTRCLVSLQNQTLGDYEVILINDGSIDHSACICNEFVQKDNRFRVIHKKNGGVSSARNIGLAVTQGEYVLFVDSDDYIDRHLLENLLQVGSYDLVLTGLTLNSLVMQIKFVMLTMPATTIK